MRSIRVEDGGFQKVDSELNPEGSEGASRAGIWEKGVLGRQPASAEALGWPAWLELSDLGEGRVGGGVRSREAAVCP